ncbi:MAG: hypothetical protein ABSH08_08640, partial [Tepidisphaeraceae bacterium]
MKAKHSLIFAIGVSGFSLAQGQVLTPEQMANPTTGQIPNFSAQEYYFGSLGIGQSDTEGIVGAVYPNQPSLGWYKYVSNGTSPVIFDMFGSNMGFGGGFAFSAYNYGEIAVYDSQGNLVADNKDGCIPATGDSNVAPTIPAGAPPVPTRYLTRQPLDPTQPVYYYGDQWNDPNVQALAQIAFVKNPQSNPLWNPSNPNYLPYANWNQYPILAAGTYFVAVCGYSTYFSGDPGDAASINEFSSGEPYQGTQTNPTYITPTTPFGFIDFSAMGGTDQINARLAGDFNND